MTTNKDIAKLLREKNYPHVRALKDGTVEIKRSYFYTMGRTPEKLAESAKQVCEDAGLKVEITDTKDQYRSWPKTSYHVAYLRPID